MADQEHTDQKQDSCQKSRDGNGTAPDITCQKQKDQGYRAWKKPGSSPELGDRNRTQAFCDMAHGFDHQQDGTKN